MWKIHQNVHIICSHLWIIYEKFIHHIHPYKPPFVDAEVLILRQKLDTAAEAGDFLVWATQDQLGLLVYRCL